MKTLEHKTVASLAALLLSAYAWGPSFAVSPGEKPYPSQAPAASQSQPMAPAQGGASQSSEAQSPAQLMQQKIQDVCARTDKDLDGYISKSEFKDAKKSDKVFKTADADHDGRLNLQECEKALGTS